MPNENIDTNFDVILDNILKLNIIKIHNITTNDNVDFQCNNDLSTETLTSNIQNYGDSYIQFLKTQNEPCKDKVIQLLTNIVIQYIDTIKQYNNTKINNMLDNNVDLLNLVSSKNKLFKNNNLNSFFKILEIVNNDKSRQVFNYKAIKNYMKNTESSKIRTKETIERRKKIEADNDNNKYLNRPRWRGGFDLIIEDNWDIWPFWNIKRYNASNDELKRIQEILSPLYFSAVVIFCLATIVGYIAVEILLDGGNKKHKKSYVKKKQNRNRTVYRTRKIRSRK
jgi:hypothetical protein